MIVVRFFRSSPLGGVCALLLLLLVSVAAMAERLAPYNPLTANYAVTRDPPLGRHVLGTRPGCAGAARTASTGITTAPGTGRAAASGWPAAVPRPHA